MVSPSDFFNEVYLRNYFMSNLLQKKGGGRDHLSPEKYLEIYGDDFEMMNVHNEKGVSLFKYIEEKDRSCDDYEELINSDNCRCY
jgi:hypothetical protein